MNKQTKIYLTFLFVFCGMFISCDTTAKNNAVVLPEIDSDYRQLYEDLQLSGKVSFQAFSQAVAGYSQIDVKKPILTLIDFSKPSTEERFFVIDMEARKVLFESLVAHGKNSGENYAISFSNEKGSNKSSLGFFLTEKTYHGKHGLSLVLDGLEQNINHNAKSRAVVIHGADYCSEKHIRTHGRLGRSWGCPALPRDITKDVIETIKDGSLVYIYSKKNNDNYLEESKFFQ